MKYVQIILNLYHLSRARHQFNDTLSQLTWFNSDFILHVYMD